MSSSSSSPSTSATKKMITLRSSDNEDFEIEEKAAILSVTIRNMVEDGCSSGTIPLANVDSQTLDLILFYCKSHANDEDHKRAREEAIADEDPDRKLYEKLYVKRKKRFDQEFAKSLNRDTLYDVLVATNYLEIDGLMDALTDRVAELIKGKSAEQIRRTFGIKKDFTPEQEEEIRRENAWEFTAI